jgi:hypothetical protein
MIHHCTRNETVIRFTCQAKRVRPVKTEDRRAGGFAMEHMQTPQASRSNPHPAIKSEYVARRLDQLEEFGKYSVVYEITRIETLLSHMFNQDGLLPT